MTFHYFDSLGDEVLPADPEVRWRVQWIAETGGWEARVCEWQPTGWGEETRLFLEGSDFHHSDALIAWQDHRRWRSQHD